MRRKVGHIGATIVNYTNPAAGAYTIDGVAAGALAASRLLTFSYPSSASGLMALLPHHFSTLSLCWTIFTHSLSIDTFSAD